MKKVLIVGGNSGIGEALKNKLLADNIEAICISKSQCGVDVIEKEPAYPAIEEPLDSLVYCPGSITLKPFQSFKMDDFYSDMELNYFGAIKTIKHYLPNLKKGTGPSIVLFSTVAVQKGMPYHVSISGAKGAVEGLTRSLAAELAPRIRVNCVAPSLTDTPLAKNLLRNDAQHEAAAKRHPLKALGAPEDVANVVHFLISDQAKWITGQVMGVDGGMSTLLVH